MNIRQELHPAEPDDDVVDELCAIAGQVVEHLDTRRDYAPLIGRFNVRAGTELTIADFDAMAGSMDTETFVRQCLCPNPIVHGDVTDAEYLEIIHSLRESEIPDHELEFWETFLEINLRCPSIGDFLADDDLTDEQVLALARASGPISL